MKAIYILLLFVLLAGGVFFGINFFSQPNGNTVPGNNISTDTEPNTENPITENQAPILSPEEQKQVEMDKATRLMNSAVITSNPILCEQISLPEMKGVCINRANLALAISEGDPLVCDILAEKSAIECRDQVYYQMAQQSGKIEDCKKIAGSKIGEKCTQEIELRAIKKQVTESGNDITKIDCENYTNQIAKEQCLVDRELLGDQGQLREALENQSSANCESISAPALKQECYDAVYFSRAKSSQNTDICDNIVNPDTKDHCKTTLSDFSDASLFERAIIEQSTKLCEKISIEGMRTSCIDRIRINEIIKSGSKADCASLTDVSLRTTCESSF